MSSTRPAEARKARAAAAMAEQRRRERQRRARVVAIGAALAVALLVVLGVAWQSSRTTSASTGATPTSATASGGFVVGVPAAKVEVRVYADFLCPVCGQFEQSTGPTLDSLVQAGTIRVEYHPIAILDRASSTQYSTRSASAAACAAEADKFRPFAEALYREQPAEGSAGLTDARLVEIGSSVGITGKDFASCVNDHRFTGWATRVTDSASKAGIVQTPTVLVNGTPLADRSPAGLQAAVAAAAKG